MFGKMQQLPRRRCPPAKILVKNLAASSKIWKQTIPTENCDIVVSVSSKFDETSCDWLVEAISQADGIIIDLYHEEKSGFRGLFITATNECLLRGAEVLCVPKSVRAVYGGGKASFTRDDQHVFVDSHEVDTFFTKEERQRIIRYIINDIRAQSGEIIQNGRLYKGESIVARLENRGLVRVLPLHDKRELDDLRQNWVQKIIRPQPLDAICDYFGVKIALYFSYLGHYTMALVIPAFVGGFVWLYHSNNESLNDSYFAGFALFNVLWATLFFVSWKRRSSELTSFWGMMNGTHELLEEPRPSYRGVMRNNEVTGHSELHYPAWKRHLFRYLVSLPVISLCLIIVLIVMLQVYHLQDYLKVMVQAGELHPLSRFVPIIILAIIIPILDSIYKVVAVWLNDMENYRLQETYSNHLIIKLMLFVNHYLSLFYAAFYLRDMTRLRELLGTILITRQIIGNLNETLRPYLAWKFNLLRVGYTMTSTLTPDETGKAIGARLMLTQAEVEARMTKYEDTFDDYLEMVIQFGYVILFSSAFPLAALCALINNVVEIRSDAFKLCYTLQRPFGQRVHNIGSWQAALEVLVVIAVIVNCALVYVFGHLHRMLPNVDDYTSIAIIVAIEHVIIVLQFLMSYAIPDTPSWITTQRAKWDFVKREAARKLTSQRFQPIGSQHVLGQVKEVGVHSTGASSLSGRGLERQPGGEECVRYVNKNYTPCRTDYFNRLRYKSKSVDMPLQESGVGENTKCNNNEKNDGKSNTLN